MLSQQEESQIRETVRRSLDNILGTPGAELAENPAPPDLERLTEAERIIAEETEQYYTARGFVRHTSRSGRVYWLARDEAERLTERSPSRRRRRRRPKLKVNRRVALVWAVTLLLAVLLVAYLVHTATYAGVSGFGGSAGDI